MDVAFAFLTLLFAACYGAVNLFRSFFHGQKRWWIKLGLGFVTGLLLLRSWYTLSGWIVDLITNNQLLVNLIKPSLVIMAILMFLAARHGREKNNAFLMFACGFLCVASVVMAIVVFNMDVPAHQSA